MRSNARSLSGLARLWCSARTPSPSVARGPARGREGKSERPAWPFFSTVSTSGQDLLATEVNTGRLLLGLFDENTAPRPVQRMLSKLRINAASISKPVYGFALRDHAPRIHSAVDGGLLGRAETQEIGVGLANRILESFHEAGGWKLSDDRMLSPQAPAEHFVSCATGSCTSEISNWFQPGCAGIPARLD